MEEQSYIVALLRANHQAKIPEFILPAWNSPDSFQEAWNDVIIDVESSPEILELLSLPDRELLLKKLRSLRASHSSYPLFPYSLVLFTNNQKHICHVLLTTEEPYEGRWGQIEIQPPEQPSPEENTFSSSFFSACRQCVGVCFILSLVGLSLTIQII